MVQSDWAQSDYNDGYNSLLDYSDPESPTLFEAKGNLKLVLPEGLPVFGLHWIGLVMLAPIIIFMSILILLPVFVVTGSHANWTNGVVTTVICLLLLWGFSFVLKLMILNRDIFPRRYFSTISDSGIAMHYSFLHFPLRNPKQNIMWQEIQSLHLTRKFFPPGLLVVQPFIIFIEIKGIGDALISMPVSPKEQDIQKLIKEIEKKSGKSFS